MGITKGTPNRKTRVRFNRFSESLIQPAIFVGRKADEIGRGEMSQSKNVRLIQGHGWRLATIITGEAVWEQEAAQTPRAGTQASHITEISTNRSQSLTGVSYNAWAIAADGLRMFIKRITAGSTWAGLLSADSASFEQADLSDTGTVDTTKGKADCDRIYVSNAIHEPDDYLLFVCYWPGTQLSKIGDVARFYFSGPAGEDRTLRGFGQYCISLGGGGVATLFERGYLSNTTDVGWVHRFTFPFKAKSGEATLIGVHSDCKKSKLGKWTGTKLYFRTYGMPHPPRHGEGLTQSTINNVISSLDAGSLTETIEFRAPGSKGRAIQPDKVRIDGRRDIRLMFNAFDESLPESGYLQDQPFDIACNATGSTPLYVDAYMDRPVGTTVTITLTPVDGATAGTPLSGTVVTDDEAGQVIQFDLPGGYPLSRRFQLKATLTSSGSKTPTFKFYVVRRDPVHDDANSDHVITFPARGSGKAMPQRVIRNTEVSGSGADAATQSASVELADMTAEATSIRSRCGTPVDIDVTDDAGTLVTRLFRGTVASVSSVDLPEGANGYPADGAWSGSVNMAGEYSRLNRRLAPERIKLTEIDALGNERPMKATAAIRTLLKYGGYPPSKIGIPDRPIRMFGASNDELQVEPDTPLGDIIQSIAEGYLGAGITFCENSGDDGMWRLIEWPRAPYTNKIVLRFDPYHPGAMKLKHVLGAYGTTTNGTTGQVIQTLPTFKTRSPSWTPPEGNVVVVIGGSTSAGIAQESHQMVQVAVNTNSVNYSGLAPSDPNYPDLTSPDCLGELVPIVLRGTELNTPEAVNFACRRAYDSGCFAREVLSFRSILPFFTDVTDPYQTRPRRPRKGDMVEVKQRDGSWKTYVINDCKPNYKRSTMMTADYELVYSSRFDQIAIPKGGFGPADYLAAILKRAGQLLGKGNMNHKWSGSQEVSRSAWGGLPAATLPPIQELDPASADYGKFYFMAGYDPVP